MTSDTWLGAASRPATVNPGSRPTDGSTSTSAPSCGPVRDSFGEVAGGALVWLGGSIGAGVVGAVAYDAIKVTLRRLRRRGGTGPVAASRADAVALAQAAVETCFGQPRMPSVLDGRVDTVETSDRGDGGWQVFLVGPMGCIKVDVEPLQPGAEQIQTRVWMSQRTINAMHRYRIQQQIRMGLRQPDVFTFASTTPTASPTAPRKKRRK